MNQKKFIFEDLCLEMCGVGFNETWFSVAIQELSVRVSRTMWQEKWELYESVTFKMTHFAFVNKSQNQYDYKWNLSLIDKCKM